MRSIHEHIKEICVEHGTTLYDCGHISNKTILEVECMDVKWCQEILLKNFNEKYPAPDPTMIVEIAETY